METKIPSKPESRFTAGLLELIVTNIVALLVTLLTFGFGAPWVICFKQKWLMDHTIIDGRRMSFDGTGLQLFGSYVKWFLLTLITLGIYGWWLQINIIRWKVSHTHVVQN